MKIKKTEAVAETVVNSTQEQNCQQETFQGYTGISEIIRNYMRVFEEYPPFACFKESSINSAFQEYLNVGARQIAKITLSST